jgi:hypothetical protein
VYGHAAVTADPATVTFTAPGQSATITLLNDGVPIPAKELNAWRLMASDHDYKHMLTLEKLDGAVKIAPSPTVESGSYDLQLDTAKGTAHVQVLTPLKDVKDAVAQTAAQTGLTEAQIREEVKLHPVAQPQGGIPLSIPPTYYEGQTLEMTLPAQPGHSYFWIVNGERVADGMDKNSISYTFKEPGDYTLDYLDTVQQDGKAVTVSSAKAGTKVISMPEQPLETIVRRETIFTAPSGYKTFAWKVDGQDVAGGATLKQRFATAGEHTVECLATSPETGPGQGFQRVRYLVAVKGK